MGRPDPPQGRPPANHEELNVYVKILESHSLGGGRDVEKGAVIDLPPELAQAKIRMKFAQVATDAEAAKAIAGAEKAAEQALKQGGGSGSGS